ncbi:MAG: restriction endonuclease [Vibrio litoralis]|uniref:restriction endonuclease n=1 Tax=Vibrio litoralis TaxID=335972 RepID=UPI003F9E840A
MIENPKPSDWKGLQTSVCKILNEVGIHSETEVTLETPRGEVEIDVFGIDHNSVEKIRYIVECKNWQNAVPQTIIHAFTTVLNETGGHIGILISKEGFQEGALKYIKHTNIVAMTFLEFQARYFDLWFTKNFCAPLAASVDTLLQYVEPVNSLRYRCLKDLDATKLEEFTALRKRYEIFAMVVSLLAADKMLPIGHLAQRFDNSTLFNIEDFKNRLVDNLGGEFSYQSIYYRDLVNEMSGHINEITDKFHHVFGRNIFS